MKKSTLQLLAALAIMAALAAAFMALGHATIQSMPSDSVSP